MPGTYQLTPMGALLLTQGRLWVPTGSQKQSFIQDSTNSVPLAELAANTNLQVVAKNENREYLMIQNNTSVSIALSIGGPNAQGIKLAAGDYYERYFNCFPQAVYATLLALASAGDYISVQEGSLMTLGAP